MIDCFVVSAAMTASGRLSQSSTETPMPASGSKAVDPASAHVAATAYYGLPFSPIMSHRKVDQIRPESAPDAGCSVLRSCTNSKEAASTDFNDCSPFPTDFKTIRQTLMLEITSQIPHAPPPFKFELTAPPLLPALATEENISIYSENLHVARRAQAGVQHR